MHQALDPQPCVGFAAQDSSNKSEGSFPGLLPPLPWMPESLLVVLFGFSLLLSHSAECPVCPQSAALNSLYFLFLHPVRPFCEDFTVVAACAPQRCSFQSDAALAGLRISDS